MKIRIILVRSREHPRKWADQHNLHTFASAYVCFSSVCDGGVSSRFQLSADSVLNNEHVTTRVLVADLFISECVRLRLD